MNVKCSLLPIAAVMVLGLGLTGCGNNDDSSVQDRNEVTTQSAENHLDENGNVRILNDHDGPLTEMVDDNRCCQQKGVNNRVQNKNNHPQTTRFSVNRSFFKQDNRFSSSDMNYHGHLNRQNGTPRTSYYNDYDGALVERMVQIASSVANVKDARAIVYRDDVVIAVVLADHHKKAVTKQRVVEAVSPYVNNRTISVLTDNANFSKVRTIDNDLRNGSPREQVNMNIKNVIHSAK